MEKDKIKPRTKKLLRALYSTLKYDPNWSEFDIKRQSLDELKKEARELGYDPDECSKKFLSLILELKTEKSNIESFQNNVINEKILINMHRKEFLNLEKTYNARPGRIIDFRDVKEAQTINTEKSFNQTLFKEGSRNKKRLLITSKFKGYWEMMLKFQETLQRVLWLSCDLEIYSNKKREFINKLGKYDVVVLLLEPEYELAEKSHLSMDKEVKQFKEWCGTVLAYMKQHKAPLLKNYAKLSNVEDFLSADHLMCLIVRDLQDEITEQREAEYEQSFVY